MKRASLFLLALCLLFSLNLNAQTQDSTIAIPNPSFENWSNGSGYSVTVLIFPLQVYSSYTYPTGWNYPTYPVNESITYSGMTVNVNTNLPLLKVANQTSGAVDGSHALKMQSFMLSDIISSTVYGLASSSLDPMLTTTVFPTVLSTGNVDIDNLLPLLSTLTANLGNLSQVLSTFVNVDINTLIEGGVSLDGVQPSKLTGYYKYTSATSGDNGGVLILGTKYNTTTHRREAVGGGYTVALTDTASYTPFEVLYTPLSEVNSSYPYVEADSLIIMMLSSANATPQQGSALFLDNLQLWAQQTVTPDTCAAVANLTVQAVDTMHATLSWTCTETPDHFEVEYGVQGFAQGSGTTQNVNGTTVVLSSLQPDTYYDVYVRSVCSSTLAGAGAMLTFHTDTLVPPVIVVPDTCASVANLTVQSVDTMHATLAWTCTETPDHFEVEYGVQGFAQGSGITQNVNGTTIALSSLQPDTYYDVYVRSVCSGTLAGAWAMLTFHTDTLVPPVIVVPDTCASVANLTVQAVDTMHATLSWTCTETPDHFEVEYGVQGFALGSGTTQNVNGTTVALSSLQPDTYYDVYVRSVCSSTLAGAWAMLTFHTDTLVPPVIPDPDTCSAVFNLHLIEVDTMNATIGWSFEGSPDHFEAEYGTQGFSQGNGTTVGVTESFLHLSDLQPDTYYDIYVRCVCDNDLFGAWAMMSFHTEPVIADTVGIQTFTCPDLRVYPNPAHGQCVVYFGQELPKTVRLFAVDGALLREFIPQKETMELSLPESGVFLLYCEMKSGVVVRKIVNR